MYSPLESVFAILDVDASVEANLKSKVTDRCGVSVYYAPIVGRVLAGRPGLFRAEQYFERIGGQEFDVSSALCAAKPVELASLSFVRPTTIFLRLFLHS